MDERSSRRIWVDALGAVGLIASLVFVGLEIRQNTVATRAGTAQAVFEENSAWIVGMLQNRPMVELLVEVQANPDTITSMDGTPEGMMLQMVARSNFEYYQNVWYQAQTGALDEQLWTLSLGAQFNSLATDPILIYHWPRMRDAYIPGFRALGDEVFGNEAGVISQR